MKLNKYFKYFIDVGRVLKRGTPSHINTFNDLVYPISFSHFNFRLWMISLLFEIIWFQLNSGTESKSKWKLKAINKKEKKMPQITIINFNMNTRLTLKFNYKINSPFPTHTLERKNNTLSTLHNSKMKNSAS